MLAVTDEYEYRPVKRARVDGAEWKQVHTYRGGGRAYRTIGGARGVLRREMREDGYRIEQAKRMLDRPGIPADDSRREYWTKLADLGFEYKIQRRPFGQWEDVP
ncbi:hypothetical protein [Umezawaea sp. NPDC059074]|uniref:hypothetical protein n=1 Tax=Umezawaea sp. NPDC059074 TaxID=3346716 RepID=UPI0036A8185B